MGDSEEEIMMCDEIVKTTNVHVSFRDDNGDRGSTRGRKEDKYGVRASVASL